MNLNILLAVLEEKGVITEDEALALTEYIQDGVQSAYYQDAQDTVKKLFAEK